MDLTRKFEIIASATELKICDMIQDFIYFILMAQRSHSAMGNLIQLAIEGPPPERNTYLIILPKKYSVVFTNREINGINSGESWRWLMYKGTDNNGYILKLS
jgi:hypothetical protein